MSNGETNTNEMTATERARAIRKDLNKSVRNGHLAGVTRATVRTRKASMMQAIDIKLEMIRPPRTMVVDEVRGETWPLTDEAKLAIERATAIGAAHGAVEWANGQTSFFDVEAVAA